MSFNKLSEQDIDRIVSKINAKATGTIEKKAASDTTEKDALIGQMLQDPSGRGLKRIAYALTEPLRKKLDYVGIGRKFLETDLLPQGAVPIYDRDFDERQGTKIAARGNAPTVESWSSRIETETFEIATLRQIKYAEMSIRRFDVLERTKNRAVMELKLAEDTEIFNLIATAATASGQNVNVTGDVTKSKIVDAITTIRGNRLEAESILMHPLSFAGIMKLKQDDLDQVNLQALLETGLMGSIFGVNIYVSTLVATDKIYIMCGKKQFGRMPIRYDLEVKPMDFPIDRSVYFSVYENVGFVIFNNSGVSTITRQ